MQGCMMITAHRERIWAEVQVYESAKQLRYGHLMIMTDQDHDGSHIKGLIMNFFHHFYPTLLKVPGFLLEFITPIVKVRCMSLAHAHEERLCSVQHVFDAREVYMQNLASGSARLCMQPTKRRQTRGRLHVNSPDVRSAGSGAPGLLLIF